MHAAQLRLIPDARPLVDRLGSEFFRRIPEAPGVYLIRDASLAVLYVGKARNLRNRLRSYRVANPELLPRRRLRLLHLARHVEWQITTDEPAATARERDLLLELKPRFNRAGVWIPQPRFFAWRVQDGALEFSLLGAPAPDWKTHRPRGASARQFRAASVRMAWIGWNAHRGPGGLPAGWFEGRLPEITRLRPGAEGTDAQAVEGHFESLIAGEPGPLMDWIAEGIRSVPSPFLQAWIAADLETLFPGITESPRGTIPGSLRSDSDPHPGNPVVDLGDPLHVTPPP